MGVIGRRNIRFGWIWILAGLVMGAILGMWSFNGPLPSPLGDYTSLPRRLMRLSHIAFIGLSMLNFFFGYEIDKIKAKKRTKQVGSWCMILGGILMPVILMMASYYEPLKYLLPIPATLVIVAVGIMVFGRAGS